MRLLMVRHGQTASNLDRALDTAIPGAPLTDEGHAQAAAFAQTAKNLEIVAVYASTATRAQQTATPIAAAHNLEVQVIDGVQEVFVGDLEGRNDQKSLHEFFQVYSSWTEENLVARMPGGESGEEIQTRFLKAIDAIKSSHSSGTVVLVSHGGTIRLGAEWLAENVTGQLATVGVLPNTGHVLLELNGDGWHCLEWIGLDLPHS
ncbi:putative phosphoglycerate mutase [Kibdelosporangium banguiense]|uniref:Phosphoglycerate mutase n=1 Tax=Kibdelosporangium banguiense TaxID=1365924 RepID=A0ABS4TB82_9PSEU|nr:histidine phosphatase family protein [Kibdelosporangium banguiense]MBP2321682.1 putative phosphoglycerate mutase [Kibdelosporangium banguiense]